MGLVRNAALAVRAEQASHLLSTSIGVGLQALRTPHSHHRLRQSRLPIVISSRRFHFCTGRSAYTSRLSGWSITVSETAHSDRELLSRPWSSI
jgi:hypothetical protein